MATVISSEKKWYASKGILGGILVCIGALANLYYTQDYPAFIAMFGVGLGIVGIRKAI
jgi:hypothetical protein